MTVAVVETASCTLTQVVAGSTFVCINNPCNGHAHSFVNQDWKKDGD